MFELPEVETIRRDLEREIVGKKIKSVEVESLKCLGRYRKRDAFSSQLDQAKVVAVERVGLWLLVGLDGGSTLVVDLGSTGSLRRCANKDEREPGTEIVVTFTQHGQLRLVDPEGTAEVFVVDTDSVAEELPEIDGYGLDPVAEPVSWTAFGRALLERRAKLKTVLTDPTFVVGIGDVYADEILFEAGLRHDRPSEQLSTQEVRRLYRAIHEVIHAAMKQRGSSLDDVEAEVAIDEEGEVAEHLKVYGREGLPCLRCRKQIVRTRVKRGTYTYYCDQCMI